MHFFYFPCSMNFIVRALCNYIYPLLWSISVLFGAYALYSFHYFTVFVFVNNCVVNSVHDM